MIRNFGWIIIILLSCFYVYDNDYFNVQTNINTLLKDFKKEVIIPGDNIYKKDIRLSYINNNDKFIPENKQELLDIYYTFINSGWNEFTFYCSYEYENCINDVKDISSDNFILSHLNSFVHPYNSYNNLYTTYYNNGKITLKINRVYDEYMILKINEEINRLIDELVSESDSIKDNIKSIHDYIIINTKYDALKLDDINDNTYQSNNAYGLLFEGYAVCSGYSDTMAIFLDKLDILNIKIATSKHVWNLVNLNNKWYHLDLTWNDPITSSGDTLLSHAYFLIDYNQLKSYDNEEHKFDINIYIEGSM